MNRNQLIRRLLSGLTDDELKNLVNIRESTNERPIPAPRTRHSHSVPPIPAPRNKVKQMLPPPEIRDEPIITEKKRALNGYTGSFEISLESHRDPLIELQNTRLAIVIYLVMC